MRDFFKQNAPGLAGVLLGGLLGLFLLLFPQTTANIVFFIFGTALIVAGVVHAILYFADDARNAIGGWQLATGIMLVLAGIAVFVLADALIAFLPFIFGLILLIGGVQAAGRVRYAPHGREHMGARVDLRGRFRGDGAGDYLQPLLDHDDAHARDRRGACDRSRAGRDLRAQVL